MLGLCRSSLYYEPAGETAENLRLMRLIDREYTAHPFFGSRQLTSWLIRQGEAVNRKRVQRLMRVMGLEAIYPKPRLSVGGAGIGSTRICCGVWRWSGRIRCGGMDITYVPLASGFMYLAAILDWFGRYVLCWRLSNTLDGSFCLEMLEEALGRGRPEVVSPQRGGGGWWVGGGGFILLHLALGQGAATPIPPIAARVIQSLQAAVQQPLRSQITAAMRVYERDVLRDVTWQGP